MAEGQVGGGAFFPMGPSIFVYTGFPSATHHFFKPPLFQTFPHKKRPPPPLCRFSFTPPGVFQLQCPHSFFIYFHMKKTKDPVDLAKVDDLIAAVVNREPISSPSKPLETTLSIEELSEEMPDLDDQRKWKMYVLAKNYELTKSKDPDVRGKALERLAKTSVVGLYETRVSVNINSLPTDELQAKLEKLVNRINEKVIPSA